jgi:Cof subfamily protein (haloacid dehalogenase superfamily)
MIKIVFFDIDGTFLNKQSKVEESTVRAIKSAKEKGIIVGLATGRGPGDIDYLLEKHDLDFAVCYNGQFIYKKDHTLISAKPIDKKSVRDIAKFADKESRELAFGLKDKMVGSRLLRAGNSEFVRLISPFLPEQLSVGLKSSFQHVVRRYRKTHYSYYPQLREPIYQLVMISPEREQARIQEKFPNVHITRSNPYSIDIIPKGGSKIKGIETVCAFYGLHPKEAMAFGDSWNDIEMIEGVGFGVAMGNAVENLKQVADFVTTANDRDGIARAFQQFRILEDEVAKEILPELTMEDMQVEDVSGNLMSLIPIAETTSWEDEPQAKQPRYTASRDENFNKVRDFHAAFDKYIQVKPIAYDAKHASFRSGFKAEEIVEFLHATSNNQPEVFQALVDELKLDIDKAKLKIEANEKHTEDVMTEQVDALVDLLYFTYGSFVLMGVDPSEIFEVVHLANMGKLWEDGTARYDRVTHKILKPEGWEEKYAPERKIKEILARHMEAGR